ncbi:MAG TPA: hypothetical protein PLK35_03975, partial [Candidatus Moranbacteria bacterium]|nr:hypothetical protein [Candidatus Moranbacteria bacterium]
AGAFTVKIVDEERKTIGEGEIRAVEKDDDLDGVDDETGSNGQEVEIKTKAVTATSKIFITPQGDPGGYLWAEKKKSADTGEYTGFIIKVSNSVEKDTKIDWWMVGEE